MSDDITERITAYVNRCNLTDQDLKFFLGLFKECATNNKIEGVKAMQRIVTDHLKKIINDPDLDSCDMHVSSMLYALITAFKNADPVEVVNNPDLHFDTRPTRLADEWDFAVDPCPIDDPALK